MKITRKPTMLLQQIGTRFTCTDQERVCHEWRIRVCPTWKFYVLAPQKRPEILMNELDNQLKVIVYA